MNTCKTFKIRRPNMTLSIGKSLGSNDLLPIHIYDGSEGHRVEVSKQEAEQIIAHLLMVFSLEKKA